MLLKPEPVARRSTAGSFGWLLSERAIRAAVAVIITGLVARHLGPAGFGTLNTAAAAVAMLLPLASLSAEAVVVRELVRRPDREREIIRTAVILRLGAGATVFAISLGMAAFTPEIEAHLAVAALVGLSLVWQSAETPEIWFRRHLRAVHPSVARLAAFLAAAGTKLGLIAADAGPAAFAFAYSLEGLLYGAALVTVFRATSEAKSTAPPERGLARRLLRESAGLAFGGMLGAVALKVDQMLVLLWLGPVAAGTYSAACRFTEIHVFVSTALAASLYPGLAELHARAPDEFRGRLERQFDLLLLAGWISATAVTLAALPAVPRLFGPMYGDAVPVVAIQSASALMLFSGVLRSQYAALTRTGWTQAVSAAVMLGTQVALGSLLIPSHGIIGAALSQGLAAIAGGWITTAILPPLRPVLLSQTRAFAIILMPWRWFAALQLVS